MTNVSPPTVFPRAATGDNAPPPPVVRPFGLLLALLLTLPLPLFRPATAAAAAPDGFRDELVAEAVDRPTALAFAPGGLLLIADKPGQLWVIDAESEPDQPALDLSAKLCDNRNRGLLGVAVDPKFSSNRAIYLFYTFNKHGQCPEYDLNGDQDPDPFAPEVPVSRVSRFTLGPDNVVDPASEKVILEGIPSYNAGNHDGGDLGFGNDDALYVSVGDGDCDQAVIDDGVRDDVPYANCQAGNPNAQKKNLVLGKILRITRDGGIPRDNPFQGNRTSRCTGGEGTSRTGRTSPGRTCQEIFARGLRNPFRIAFDPNAKGTRFFINDVGNNSWEEVNAGRAKANYGHNVREGNCRVDSLTEGCRARPPKRFTNPVYAYPHDGSECRSITGGAFYPAAGGWPAAYKGDYFYADIVCGTIFTLSPTRSGKFKQAPFAGDFGRFAISDIAFGPADLGQPRGQTALYYATFAGGAQVRRLALDDAATASRATADRTVGEDPRSASGPDRTDKTQERKRGRDQDRAQKPEKRAERPVQPNDDQQAPAADRAPERAPRDARADRENDGQRVTKDETRTPERAPRTNRVERDDQQPAKDERRASPREERSNDTPRRPPDGESRKQR